jgi:hypothetical protein
MRSAVIVLSSLAEDIIHLLFLRSGEGGRRILFRVCIPDQNALGNSFRIP